MIVLVILELHLGPHKYSYVHGDPVQGIDPTGEFLTGSLGGIGARLYMGAKIASVALNTYGFVSNTVDAAQYARSGQFLRATYHAMWATIDGIALGTELVGFFKPPTPPPSLAFSVVAASGNALSVSLRWQQLIAVSRPLAIWALDHILPAITRSSAGLLGSYVAMMQGFQPLDTSSTSNVRNNYTGAASGGDNLPVVTNGDEWLSGGIGFFPKQVADKLRGRVFTSFKDFREAFWTAVSEVPVLRNSFSPSNQALISKGKAPFATPAEQLGGRKVFELDHIETLKIGRGQTVYNMDEIMVAGPRVHDELTYPLRQAGSTAR